VSCVALSGAGLYNCFMHYVYILQSTKDTSHYVGVSANLRKRLLQHNSGESKYSKTKRPLVLIWYCAFKNKARALAFEKYLKHGSGHAFARKHLT